MKIFCFILSLFVLSLSTVPCCSVDNCNDEIKTAYAYNHSQDHKDSDCNTCSPFFTCGTCAGSVITGTRLGVDINKVPFIKEKFIIVYKSQIVNNFIAKIWQPPKIS